MEAMKRLVASLAALEADARAFTRAELEGMAFQAGVEVPQVRTKGELVEALRKAVGSDGVAAEGLVVEVTENSSAEMEVGVEGGGEGEGEAGAGGQVEPEGEGDADADSETEAEPEVEVDADSDGDSDSDSDSEAEPEAESGTSDDELEPAVEAAPETEASNDEPEPAVEAAPAPSSEDALGVEPSEDAAAPDPTPLPVFPAWVLLDHFVFGTAADPMELQALKVQAAQEAPARALRVTPALDEVPPYLAIWSSPSEAAPPSESPAPPAGASASSRSRPVLEVTPPAALPAPPPGAAASSPPALVRPPAGAQTAPVVVAVSSARPVVAPPATARSGAPVVAGARPPAEARPVAPVLPPMGAEKHLRRAAEELERAALLIGDESSRTAVLRFRQQLILEIL